MEQAGGSEEEEDDLGRMLQDQAEYRSPAPDWPGTRRWASRPWSWPRATTPPGNPTMVLVVPVLVLLIMVLAVFAMLLGVVVRL